MNRILILLASLLMVRPLSADDNSVQDAVKFDLRAIESLPGQISWRLRENIGPMNTATRTAKPALDGLHLSSAG
jgi:hypothetical protein